MISPKLSPVAIRDIWKRYKFVRSDELRNTLMENYLHLVRYNAERIHVKLPEEVQIDDLMSAGIFGLMDAINAFDLDRGVKFETYCAPRIRGAILDELRAMDWVPRLVRARSSKLGGVTKQLKTELGRSPTNEEIAKRLRIPMEEFEKLARDASAVELVSLSRKWYETDSQKDVREIDVLTDPDAVDPVRALQRKQIKEFITRGLTRAERLIIILYYYEEFTMKEVSLALGFSESRISQVHASIKARMKAVIGTRIKRELAA
ncbi:MAG: FliA/WhiG family RNA polymerase sigma factor [bacterium]|nr:FliA/WhiG family RNA polymerase sigma factor [bacterium]